MAEVLGFCCAHRIITDKCRESGEVQARVEAINSAEIAVRDAMRGYAAGRGVQIHVVVTVEQVASDVPDHVSTG